MRTGRHRPRKRTGYRAAGKECQPDQERTRDRREEEYRVATRRAATSGASSSENPGHRRAPTQRDRFQMGRIRRA